MSLGGYKFAGRYCQKGSLTDVQWALLMHKTRLVAFMAANALSGAGWHFCKNGGTIDFGTDTGVIYDINGNGYNFVSFLQYSTEEKYIAIVSMPNQTTSFNSYAVPYGRYIGTTNYYAWSKRSMFHCASLSEFSDYQFMLSGHTYPVNALGLLPITSTWLTESFTSCTTNDQWSFFYLGSSYPNYFGYAIKEDRVISLAANGTSSNLSNGCISVSVIGFDAMSLLSSSDSFNIFHAMMTADNSTGECVFSSRNDYRIGNQTIQTLTYQGERFAENNLTSILFFGTCSPAFYIGSFGDKVPFSSTFITSTENGIPSNEIRTSKPFTVEGCLSKGIVDVDFVSTNNTNSYSGLMQCGTYANGNYLLSSKDTGGHNQFYVGWDPSNPDITQASSWQLYDGT